MGGGGDDEEGNGVTRWTLNQPGEGGGYAWSGPGSGPARTLKAGPES